MDEESKPTPPDSGDDDSGKETPAAEPAAAETSGEESQPEETVAAADETAESEQEAPGESSSEKPAETQAKPAAASKPQPSAQPQPPKRPKRPPRKKGPVYEDLEEDSLADALKAHLDGGLVSAQSFLKQAIYTVDLKRLLEAMVFLKEDQDFDYLVDVTALDYLGDEERWCLVFQLFSHSSKLVIRVKCRLGENEVAPSMSSIWKSADWMEREVFDMFGIEFAGHPDLKRILLPDDWHGYPLRKDYDIKLQDQSWIDKHLRIRKVPD